MFEKKSVIATAILAGLVSGLALAEEAASPATAEGGAKMEKKNECKTKKSAHKRKKGDKDACSGQNGCDGKDMKKPAAGKAADAPAAPAPEKKAE